MLTTLETTLPLMALGYLSGTWLGALTVCRLAGVRDPRLAGSCNPGFSNVLRLHGMRLALATLLVDTVKGMPVLGLALLGDLPPWAQGLVGLGVMLGHSYPVWYRFRGGRAVASAFGVMLLLTPRVALCCALLWCLLAWSGRTAALASLASAALAPLFALWLAPAYTEVVIVFTLLVLVRHALYLRGLSASKRDD
ncbi:glycerol-3-phosphate acyltransferase [Halomonas elongata]|uniref:glycerol-3-phosphate acyltransferase n=1 Tax=Halomonas elongata TaxID=2746 RepID=UPI0023AF88C4|nr:glycerol-3-phosphate acyltransferase [Halomonas elongata]